MFRKLFALVVLAALASAGYYYWTTQQPGFESTDFTRGMGEVGQRIQDAALGGAVKAALRLNRNLEPYDVRPEVEDGVVTLRGSVSSEDLKRQAADVAAAVPEVQQVVNHLEVAAGAVRPEPTDERSLGERVDDEALEVQVRLALSLNRELKGTDLKVQALRRQVTLSGSVVTAAQRELAGKVARNTKGTAGVTDRIAVRPEGGHGDPEATRASVEQAFAGNPHLAAYRLRASAENGRLVIQGRVRTEIEKELAGALARAAAGGPVDNTVEVKP